MSKPWNPREVTKDTIREAFVKQHLEPTSGFFFADWRAKDGTECGTCAAGALACEYRDDVKPLDLMRVIYGELKHDNISTRMSHATGIPDNHLRAISDGWEYARWDLDQLHGSGFGILGKGLEDFDEDERHLFDQARAAREELLPVG